MYKCDSPITFDPTELIVSRDPHWEPCADMSELNRGISAIGLLCPDFGILSCDPESYDAKKNKSVLGVCYDGALTTCCDPI